MYPIEVSVQHSSPVLNAGLAALLSACQDIQVRQPGDGRVSGPDIIITDYNEGLAHLRYSGSKGARVLIMTHLEREWDVRRAMQAGVAGYLPQCCDPMELVQAVRAIDKGKIYIDRDLSNRVAQTYDRVSLTGREHEVLALLARGCCNKSIARELGIGIGTVKTHVKGVFEKLGATARTHAVVLANERGLVN